MKHRSRTPALTLASLAALVPLASNSAHAQTPAHPACAADQLVEPRVQLSWSALPTSASVATSTSPNASLALRNTSADAVDYELVARVHARGERRELSLASGTLAPAGASTAVVPLAGLGIDIQDLKFSGSVQIEARARTTSGALLDRSFAPTLYFHRESSGLTRTYRDAARLAQFNGGDLQHSIFSTLPRSVRGVFDGGAGVGLASEDSGPVAPRELATPVALGANRWEFCMRWVYESIDSGFGEDHYVSGTLMKARGMKVIVDHDEWAGPQTFYCNQDNGCFSFEAPQNHGFVVTVVAEARLGDGDDITVKAFESRSDSQNFPNDPPQWVFEANPYGVGRRVYYQNEPSEISNLMAFGSFVFHQVDSHTSPGLSGPRTMVMMTDNPTCSGGGSCQPDDEVQMEPGKSNRKFLVGHEVGHWIHRQWTDDDMGYFDNSWSANSSDADCAFLGVGAHAMRSKERSSGGFVEGFAHYLSALAWNRHDQTDGMFKYYKEVADPVYADMAGDNWRVDLEGSGGAPLGGVSNWMANMCFVTDGHSVEMDWLRCLWDYRTNSGTKPTHWEIFDHVRFTRMVHPWTSTTTYDRLSDAIDDPALGQTGSALRFKLLAISNGVAQ